MEEIIAKWRVLASSSLTQDDHLLATCLTREAAKARAESLACADGYYYIHGDDQCDIWIHDGRGDAEALTLRDKKLIWIAI